jgi:glucan 1,3-beta-glucosidase
MLTFTSNLYERRVGFNWGSDKVRGVNLGGWLVLES